VPAGRVAVPRDPSYAEEMSYQGVPLRALLAALPPDPADTIQARAKDGFVAGIPRALIGGAAVPWIAIENALIRGLRCEGRRSRLARSTWSGKIPNVRRYHPSSGFTH
jgi:hypothetical protein